MFLGLALVGLVAGAAALHEAAGGLGCSEPEEVSMLQQNLVVSGAIQRERANVAVRDRKASEAADSVLAGRLAANSSADDPSGVDAAVSYGSSGCKCLGIDHTHGFAIANISGKNVTFPSDIGAHCAAWDRGTHPDCLAASPPDWCSQQWCYVDQRSCDADAAPPTQTYFAHALYQDLEVHYSYETCGSTDSYTNSVDESVWGLEACGCINIANRPGVINATIDNMTVAFPESVGSTCEAWDDGRNPECIGSGEKPDWCSKKWCYVDPCTCTSVTPAVSSMLPDANFHGHTVYYSYDTCGSTDTYTATGNADACVNQQTKEACAASADKCLWAFIGSGAGYACRGLELATACGQSGSDASGDNVAVSYGSSGCKCLGIDHTQGFAMANISGKNVTFPSDIGAHCAAWDRGTHPDCLVASPPDWCSQPWCYVDPCSCGADAAPPTQTYFAYALYQDLAVHYSYETCGSTDSYTADDHEDGVAAVACDKRSADESVWGLEACGCINIANRPGEINATIDNMTVAFPESVGSTCEAWDEGRNPECIGSGDKPDWCSKKWCYVDPCTCTGVTPAVSSMLPDANFHGHTVYYSYDTCGSTDTYTATGNADACVNQQTEEACAASADKCLWAFMGSGAGYACRGLELATACGQSGSNVKSGAAQREFASTLLVPFAFALVLVSTLIA